MTKQALRELYHSKRHSLSDEAYHRLNENLTNRFFEDVDLLSIKVLHTFLPISKNKEPDTWNIVHKIQSGHLHIKISIPRINPQTVSIESFYLNSREQLETNRLGMPEPVTGTVTAIPDIDLVLVPLLCIDKKGNRVGYGKGYYDRFLSRCRSDCKKVGLSFFEPVDHIDDVSSMDVPVDVCVTPGRTYFF